MNCEICGRELPGEPLDVKIEGSLMRTCRACSRLGETMSTRRPIQRTVSASTGFPKKKKKILEIADDYSQAVRKKRESLGLTQDQLGGKINEKGSVISRIESGHMEPDLKVAKKLERFLSITLLKEMDSE